MRRCPAWKIPMLVLAMVLVLPAVLSASPEKEQPGQGTTSAQAATGSKVAEFYQKYSPPISLTQNVTGPEDQTVFFPGDNWKSNQFTEWALDKLGIIWAPKWPSPDGQTAQQNLTLAIAANDLPDVITFGAGQKAMIIQLAQRGMILPLGDLYKRYASAMTKELLEESNKVMNGLMFKAAVVNGDFYGIPMATDTYAGTIMWYREDVLKDMGMAIPTTIAQFEQAMAAYKARLPEDYPLAINKDLNYGDSLWGAFGAYRGIWLDKNGKLEYGSISPNVKTALATLNGWYAKGYIDPEFIVKDFTKVSREEMSAGQHLASEHGWWAVWTPAPQLYANTPGAKMNFGPNLIGPSGMSGTIEPIDVSGYVAISAKCKHPEALFYQLNLQLDSCYRNDQALRSRYTFVYPPEPNKGYLNPDEVASKGQSYQRSDYKNPGPGNASSYFWNRGSNAVWYGIGFGQRPGELASQMISVAKMAAAKSTGSTDYEKQLWKTWLPYFGGYDQLKIAAGGAAQYILDGVLGGTAKTDRYMGPPTPTMIEKSSYLQKVELETFVKIITGETPVGDFDKFVTTWRSSGGDAITSEVNAWYQSVK